MAIIFLSLVNGGLGLTKHFGIRTENAILLNQIYFHGFLSSYSPSDFMHINNNLLYANEIIPGTSEEVVNDTELTSEMLGSLTTVNASNILKSAAKKVNIAIAKRIAMKLAINPNNRSFAAWFISQGSGTSCPNSFIRAFNGTQSASFFGKQNFIDRIRLSLCVGPYNEYSPLPILCPCGNQYLQITDPLHCIHCFENRASGTRRHTSIKNLLLALIRSLHPLDYAEPEQSVGKRLTSQIGVIPEVYKEVICDILWEHGPVSHVIDLVVVDPCAPMYNSAIPSIINPRAFDTVNAAALAAEKRKRSHYGRVCLPVAIAPSRVIPFAIEATGRLGPSAIACLFQICGSNTVRRSKFLNDVSLICARFSGKILSASRDHRRAEPQNGVV